MNLLKKAENTVGAATRGLAAFCLFVVFALFLLNVLTRLPFITWNPTWIDEVIKFFLVWMIFLGAMELTRTGSHFMVDILVDKFHGTLFGRIMRIISTLIMLVTFAVVLFFGVRLVMTSAMKATYTLPSFVTMSWFYLCIPVSAFFMVLYSFRDVVLAFADLIKKGEITRRKDLEKAQAAMDDEDARAIREAAQALKDAQHQSTTE